MLSILIVCSFIPHLNKKDQIEEEIPGNAWSFYNIDLSIFVFD